MPRGKWFDAEARAEWKRVVPIMEDRLHISPDNRALLVSYCMAWSGFVRAQREIAQAGSPYFETASGYMSVIPAVAISKQSREAFEKLADKLGFSPQSRDTIDPVRQPDEKQAKASVLDRDPNAPIDFSTAVRL